MDLTQEQIEKLSKNLCKLSTKDKWKITKDLNSIIWYMEILNEIDTTWVKPTISVVKWSNSLREDNLKEKDINTKDLLSCSNQKVIASQIALPNIMK